MSIEQYHTILERLGQTVLADGTHRRHVEEMQWFVSDLTRRVASMPHLCGNNAELPAGKAAHCLGMDDTYRLVEWRLAMADIAVEETECKFCRGRGQMPFDQGECRRCDGLGTIISLPQVQCELCRGEGFVQIRHGGPYDRQHDTRRYLYEPYPRDMTRCDECRGRGKVPTHEWQHPRKWTPMSIDGNAGMRENDDHKCPCVGDQPRGTSGKPDCPWCSTTPWNSQSGLIAHGNGVEAHRRRPVTINVPNGPTVEWTERDWAAGNHPELDDDAGWDALHTRMCQSPADHEPLISEIRTRRVHRLGLLRYAASTQALMTYLFRERLRAWPTRNGARVEEARYLLSGRHVETVNA